MKHSVLKNGLIWALPVAIAFLLSSFFFQLLLIQGNSMAPSYHNLQLVVLDKRIKNCEAGDVIAFRCEGLSSVLVKRVAAVPGDRVIISDGTLWVNDQISSAFPTPRSIAEPGLLTEPLYLNPGEYIVLGDNLPESKDSRYAEVGIVTASSILGRVIFPK